jgi:hypothetical protein
MGMGPCFGNVSLTLSANVGWHDSNVKCTPWLRDNIVKRLMNLFDAWLHQHQLLKNSDDTIFQASIPAETPQWIHMWILDEYMLLPIMSLPDRV